MTGRMPENWDRLQELFGAALDRNAEQRGAFVAEACGGDRALQARLEELLVAHQEAQQIPEFLTPDDTSWSEVLEEVTDTPPDAPVNFLASPARRFQSDFQIFVVTGTWTALARRFIHFVNPLSLGLRMQRCPRIHQPF